MIKAAKQAGSPYGVSILELNTALLPKFSFGPLTRQVRAGEVEVEALAVRRLSAGAHVCGQPLRNAFHSADWNAVAIAEHPGRLTGPGLAWPACSGQGEDAAPLLMRAWALSPHERDVTRLVVDGLLTDGVGDDPNNGSVATVES